MSKSKKVYSNLLKQNVYLRDCSPCTTQDLGMHSAAEYTSVDEVVTDDGIKLDFKKVEYPITPGYVNSFADSCDYKSDPLGTIAKSSAPGPNLGDISAFQEVCSMDMMQARELYARLKEVFSRPKSESKSVPDSNSPNKNESDGGKN